MAGVDLASGRPQGKKTATLRRPKRRVGIRIDMTPMVDIAFLLLIFYMVTTIFMQPQAMEISLPPDKEKSVPIKESNLLIFRVDEDGTVYKNFGKEKPEVFSLDTLRAYLIKENQEKPKLTTFVKIHKEAKYSIMVEFRLLHGRRDGVHLRGRLRRVLRRRLLQRGRVVQRVSGRLRHLPDLRRRHLRGGRDLREL